jgi:hypothetical protein
MARRPLSDIARHCQREARAGGDRCAGQTSTSRLSPALAQQYQAAREPIIRRQAAVCRAVRAGPRGFAPRSLGATVARFRR